MLVAFDLTDEPEYLFYVLKWILKYDFDDIVYEMYCQDVLNPEDRRESLIKPSRWSECCSKYHDRFEKDFMDTEICDADSDLEQELPF